MVVGASDNHGIDMASQAVQFLAVVLTALSLVPAGAHLFAAPNKLFLGKEAYFIVQGIYRGWNRFGVVLVGALLANLVLAYVVRADRLAFSSALVGAIGVALTLALFFGFTFPANVATDNWTIAPADWKRQRARWEAAHAAGAVLTFISLCATTLSVLMS